MTDYSLHIIKDTANVKEALEKLNQLTEHLTLFVVDNDYKLIGSITDGDIRRGLIKGRTTEDPVTTVMNRNFKYLKNNEINIHDIRRYREGLLDVIPIVGTDFTIERVINLTEVKTILPIHVAIMAGGEGKRLRPLTETVPKPLLKVGNKPIIEYNIDRLITYGVESIHISVNYLGDKIKEYFGNGESKGIKIKYITETSSLGTVGALSLGNFDTFDTILFMNSDLLTDIDFEDFYLEFVNSGADLAVVSIPYKVNVPFGVLETENTFVHSLVEKPTYTYYSNAGIYLIKKEILNRIPYDKFYNATDLMEDIIKKQGRVVNYPHLSYWLDIGRMEDFEKAQRDIRYIKL
jgi:dTDP-glucose pyrophosphorylase